MDSEKKHYIFGKNGGNMLTDAIRAEIILLVFIILLSGLLLFACRSEGGGSGARSVTRFSAGTVVLDTDIGGLTRAEAEAALRRVIENGRAGYRCSLVCGEERFLLDGSELNIESDLSSVLDEALARGEGNYAVRFFPAADEKLDAAVASIAAEINTEPQCARLVLRDGAEPASGIYNERFAVLNATDGVMLDEAGAKKLLRSGKTEITLPVFNVPASGAMPKLPVLMAEFSTSFAESRLCSEARVFNIEKAAKLLNGRSLTPGESLSCNAVLGERTAEAGWKQATAFANGGRDTEQQYGGGICQVSTTLYNCALLAGLNVPERASHSRKVSYIAGGLDAALSWSGADLVIRNGTAEKIYIFMWTDSSAKKLSCAIYGGGFTGYDSIRIESELVERLEPGEAEFVDDPSLSVGECVLLHGAASGSSYRAFRIFLKNGAEVWREELSGTVYPARNAVYAVAPGEG